MIWLNYDNSIDDCNSSTQTMLCHNKGITDFEFLGSCSLIATSEWD